MTTTPHQYRTHTSATLTDNDIGREVTVAGWADTIRDHGGVIFIDLRDHYGVVQAVTDNPSLADGITKECVVSVQGRVEKRDSETVNPKIPTGNIELRITKLDILGTVTSPLPFEIGDSTDTSEEIRLRYRFLDLRNPEVHDRIVLRSKLISYMRKKMEQLGFMEIQTPILTASSPEGARDFLVPSRKHKGKFYALPQAPQIFKQLLMVSGFDRYFQIAPCFRDEDARADRSPGEFYQLDFEMAFATQEDVFSVAENVLYSTFSQFSDKKVYPAPFPRIPYDEAMLKYGSDKPDLRNPLQIADVTDAFADATFPAFKNCTIRSITVKDCVSRPKSFFEGMLEFATSIGMKGLGYVKVEDDMSYAGPIDKFLTESGRAILREKGELKPGCVMYFIADKSRDVTAKFAGQIRSELGNRLGLIEDCFKLCFVVDFPMYEKDEHGKPAFMHNPFSLPQSSIEGLEGEDIYKVKAFQYDIVCNGVELSSGAERNHKPELLIKAFEIAGYNAEDVKQRFSSLYNAFKYGAPPHAGMAPGVDRILMLITGQSSIREVIAFPMNSNAQDLLLGAPSEVNEAQLREVHIKLR